MSLMSLLIFLMCPYGIKVLISEQSKYIFQVVHSQLCDQQVIY